MAISVCITASTRAYAYIAKLLLYVEIHIKGIAHAWIINFHIQINLHYSQ